MYLIVTILISLFVNFSTSQRCPPSEDVFPCKCIEKGTTYGRNLYGTCDGLTSLEQLQNSIRGFHAIKLDTFSVSHSSFDYIPFDLFENMNIHHLEISKSNFSRIANLGDPQFLGLQNSLESLSIDSSFTRAHPFAYVNMSHLQKLSSLELWNNHVEVLHNEWFKEGPVSLEVVRFVKGKIRRVGYRAFQALTNLKIVDLSENDITFIPRSIFPEEVEYLEELYLERNDIDHFPEDFFNGMPSLMIVNLELNKFTTIDQSLWKPVWRDLLYLNIDYNPLVCDKKIKWMYKTPEELKEKLIATCYKPFSLSERELKSLREEEIQ